jgi:trehalose-6-phosphatase
VTLKIIQQTNKREISVSPDYNGTVTPIVRDPKRAYMSDKVNEIVFLFRSPGDPEGTYI